ncbi:hypothetical protein CRUP_032230, partial [Coryphaenoides rupestris]
MSSQLFKGPSCARFYFQNDSQADPQRSRGQNDARSAGGDRQVLSVGVSVENVPLRLEIFCHLPPSGIIRSACDAVG